MPSLYDVLSSFRRQRAEKKLKEKQPDLAKIEQDAFDEESKRIAQEQEDAAREADKAARAAAAKAKEEARAKQAEANNAKEAAWRRDRRPMYVDANGDIQSHYTDQEWEAEKAKKGRKLQEEKAKKEAESAQKQHEASVEADEDVLRENDATISRAQQAKALARDQKRTTAKRVKDEMEQRVKDYENGVGDLTERQAEEARKMIAEAKRRIQVLDDEDLAAKQEALKFAEEQDMRRAALRREKKTAVTPETGRNAPVTPPLITDPAQFEAAASEHATRSQALQVEDARRAAEIEKLKQENERLLALPHSAADLSADGQWHASLIPEVNAKLEAQQRHQQSTAEERAALNAQAEALNASAKAMQEQQVAEQAKVKEERKAMYQRLNAMSGTKDGWTYTPGKLGDELKAVDDAVEKHQGGDDAGLQEWAAKERKRILDTAQQAQGANLETLWQEWGQGTDTTGRVHSQMVNWTAKNHKGEFGPVHENFSARVKELGLDEKQAREYLETRRQMDWSTALDPEKEKQAAEWTRPLRERFGLPILEPVRKLPNGAILPNPVLGADKAAFEKAVEDAEGTPEQKAEALKKWPEYRRNYGEGLLATFAQQSAFGEDFNQWREENPMPSSDPVEQALAYEEAMRGRNVFRRWGDVIASNVTAGFMDVTQAGLGSAAALTGWIPGTEGLSELAAANSENANSLVVGQQQLSGTGMGGSILGAIARMAPGVAATVGTGSLAGATVFGAAQTGGMLYGDAYAKLRNDGKTHEEAWRAAAPASAVAGAMTALLTRLFPGGAEALVNNPEARAGVRAMIAGAMSSGKAVVKGAFDEIPEELIDEGISQLAQGYAEGKSPDEAVTEFITGLPEIVAAAGLMGGGMQAVKDRMDKANTPAQTPANKVETPLAGSQSGASTDETGPDWISKTGIERAAARRRDELLAKKNGDPGIPEITLPNGVKVPATPMTIGEHLNYIEEQELEFLNAQLEAETFDHDAVAKKYGKKVKQTKEVKDAPAPAPAAPSDANLMRGAAIDTEVDHNALTEEEERMQHDTRDELEELSNEEYNAKARGRNKLKRRATTKNHAEFLASAGVDMAGLPINAHITSVTRQNDGSFEVRIEHHQANSLTPELVRVRSGDSITKPGKLRSIKGVGTVVDYADGTTVDAISGKPIQAPNTSAPSRAEAGTTNVVPPETTDKNVRATRADAEAEIAAFAGDNEVQSQRQKAKLTALLKVADGKKLVDFSDEELRSLGLNRDGTPGHYESKPVDKKDPSKGYTREWKPGPPKDQAGIQPVVVEHGELIITQPQIDRLKKKMPAVASQIGLSEVERRKQIAEAKSGGTAESPAEADKSVRAPVEDAIPMEWASPEPADAGTTNAMPPEAKQRAAEIATVLEKAGVPREQVLDLAAGVVQEMGIDPDGYAAQVASDAFRAAMKKQGWAPKPNNPARWEPAEVVKAQPSDSDTSTTEEEQAVPAEMTEQMPESQRVSTLNKARRPMIERLQSQGVVFRVVKDAKAAAKVLGQKVESGRRGVSQMVNGVPHVVLINPESNDELIDTFDHEAIHAADLLFEASNPDLAAQADAVMDRSSPEFDRELEYFLLKEYNGFSKLTLRQKAKEARRAIVEGRWKGRTSTRQKGFRKYLSEFLEYLQKIITGRKSAALADAIANIEHTLGIEQQTTQAAADETHTVVGIKKMLAMIDPATTKLAASKDWIVQVKLIWDSLNRESQNAVLALQRVLDGDAKTGPGLGALFSRIVLVENEARGSGLSASKGMLFIDVAKVAAHQATTLEGALVTMSEEIAHVISTTVISREEAITRFRELAKYAPEIVRDWWQSYHAQSISAGDLPALPPAKLTDEDAFTAFHEILARMFQKHTFAKQVFDQLLPGADAVMTETVEPARNLVDWLVDVIRTMGQRIKASFDRLPKKEKQIWGRYLQKMRVVYDQAVKLQQRLDVALLEAQAEEIAEKQSRKQAQANKAKTAREPKADPELDAEIQAAREAEEKERRRPVFNPAQKVLRRLRSFMDPDNDEVNIVSRIAMEGGIPIYSEKVRKMRKQANKPVGGEMDWLERADIPPFWKGLLFSKGSVQKVDTMLEMLHKEGYFPDAATPADVTGEMLAEKIAAVLARYQRLQRGEADTAGTADEQYGNEMAHLEAQRVAFDRATASGPIEVQASQLTVGDRMQVKGADGKLHPVEVIALDIQPIPNGETFDPDGNPAHFRDADGRAVYLASVTLKDGTTFGVQTIDGEQGLFVDQLSLKEEYDWYGSLREAIQSRKLDDADAVVHFMEHEGIPSDAPWSEIITAMQGKLRLPMAKVQKMVGVGAGVRLGTGKNRDLTGGLFGADEMNFLGDRNTLGLFEQKLKPDLEKVRQGEEEKKPVSPSSFTLEPTTKEELDAEKRREELKQKLRERQDKPLIGTVGDIGQGQLFGGGDLFAPPPAVETVKPAESGERRAEGPKPPPALSAPQKRVVNALLPRLTALHNLSEENLAFAARMGGLAVPSIAVLPEGMGMSGFGRVTLIGTKDMADPTQNPVFDADAYTVRFPDPEYKKARVGDTEKVTKMLRPFAQRFNDSITQHVWDNAVNRPKPEDSVKRMLNSPAAMAAFLQTQGVDVEPVMIDKPLEVPWLLQPSMKPYLEPGKISRIHGNDDEELVKLTQAIETALASYADDHFADLEPSIQQYLRASERREWLGDKGVHFGKLLRLEKAVAGLGTQIQDVPATKMRLDEALEGREAAFKNWVERTILPLYAPPQLTLKGRKVSYTLENIVAAMSSPRIKGREDTMTFGEGAARAAVSTRFKDLEKMRSAAAEQIVPEEQVKETRDAAQKLLGEYREQVAGYTTLTNYRGAPDIWEAMDASMRALTRWAKGGRTPAALRAALRAESFANVPEDVIKIGQRAAEAWLLAPVPYFEAKPQRAVPLGEFAGAVIPESASDETKGILESAGVPFRTYEGEAAQSVVAAQYARELHEQGRQTLFSARKRDAAQTSMERREDMKAQAEWLAEQARGMGLADADLLPITHPEKFDRLAARWRATHPQNKSGNFVQNAGIRAIVSRLYGKPEPTAENTLDDRAGAARTHLRAAAANARDTPAAAGHLEGHDGSPAGLDSAKRASAPGWKRWLKEFAEKRGILLTRLPRWIENRIHTDEDIGGMEHHVFDMGPRVLKVTRGTGSSFGLWAKPTPGKTEPWTLDYIASPARYLQKMQDANTLFGDDIVLHAVVVDKRWNTNLILSQPKYDLLPTSTEEVQDAMTASGFAVSRSLPSAFYRAADNTAVLDLHLENGGLNPGPEKLLISFDATVFKPTGALREALARDAGVEPGPEDVTHYIPLASARKRDAAPVAALTRESVFAHRLAVAKREIEQDMQDGTVPPTVTAFRDLHDHVDANLYVNDAERGADRQIGPLGRSLGWKTQDYADFTNELIEALDAWLKSGRPADVSPSPSLPVSQSSTDAAAHEAATSPENDLPEPTPAQKEAGNYQKGHVTIAGHEISIENPAGSKRRPEWPALQDHYGYFKGTNAKDGDHVDVFVKPGTPEDYAGPVHVVRQNKVERQKSDVRSEKSEVLTKTSQFDEYKVMLGYPTAEEARAAYLRNYEPGWPGLHKLTTHSMAEFQKIKDQVFTVPADRVPGVREADKALASAPKRDSMGSMADPDKAAQSNTEPSPGGLSEAEGGHSALFLARLEPGEKERYLRASAERQNAVKTANAALDSLKTKRTSGIQWDESYFNGDEGMLPVPEGEMANEWFIIDPEGFENYDNLRIQISKYDDGYHARWDTTKTDGIIGDYRTLNAAKEAAEAYFIERAGEELSSSFGANLDSQHAIRGIFEHFAVPDGVEFDGWGRTKWGSWYAHARGYDLKRDEVRTLKLSVRDHDATRKDLGLPDLAAEVSKNWLPEEVSKALTRLEERVWARLQSADEEVSSSPDENPASRNPPSAEETRIVETPTGKTGGSRINQTGDAGRENPDASPVSAMSGRGGDGAVDRARSPTERVLSLGVTPSFDPSRAEDGPQSLAAGKKRAIRPNPLAKPGEVGAPPVPEVFARPEGVFLKGMANADWNRLDKAITNRLGRVVATVAARLKKNPKATDEDKGLDWLAAEALEGLEHAAGTPITDAKQRESALDAIKEQMRKAWKATLRQFMPDATVPADVKAKLIEMRASIALSQEKALDVSKRALENRPKLVDVLAGKNAEAFQNPEVRRKMYLAMNAKIDSGVTMDDLTPEQREVAQSLKQVWWENGMRRVRNGTLRLDTFQDMAEGMPQFYEEDVNLEKGFIPRFLKLGLKGIVAQRSTRFHIIDKSSKDKKGEFALVDWTDPATKRKDWKFKSKAHMDAAYGELIESQILAAKDARAADYGQLSPDDIRTLRQYTWMTDEDRAALAGVTREKLRSPATLTKEQAAVVERMTEQLHRRFQKKNPLKYDQHQKAGLIEDPFYAIARALLESGHDNATAEFFNYVAKQPDYVRDAPENGFTEMQDDPRLGRLAGKWVRDDVAAELTQMLDLPNMVMRFYDWLLAGFKYGHTILNAGSHVRNVIGNVAFAQLAGSNPLNPGNWKAYAEANRLLREGGPTFEALHKLGVIGGDYLTAEVRKALRQLLPDPDTVERMIAAGDMSWLTGLKEQMARKSDKLGKVLGKITGGAEAAWKWEDDIYKVAAFIKARQQGMTEEQAAAHVRKWFPYYDKGTSGSLKALGRFVFPFLSFKRESLRIMGNALKERPVSFLTMMALPRLITQLSLTALELQLLAAGLGLEDEDKEDLLKALKGRAGGLLAPFTDASLFAIALPVMDGSGGMMQWDLSAAVPWSDWLSTRIEHGAEQPWFQRVADQVVSGAPFLSLVGETWRNQDAFSGRRLWEDDMSSGEKHLKVAAHAYMKLTPPLLGPHIASMMRSLEQQPSKLLPQRNPAMQFARIMGLDIKPLSPDLYRKADEYRKSIGAPVPPRGGQAYPKDAASRARARLYMELIQPEIDTEAADEAFAALEGLGEPVRSLKDLHDLFKDRNAETLLPAKMRNEFVRGLPPASRRVYDAARDQQAAAFKRSSALMEARRRMKYAAPPAP